MLPTGTRLPFWLRKLVIDAVPAKLPVPPDASVREPVMGAASVPSPPGRASA